MKTSDLTEMEWLAATLHHTAERLQRAVELLRAAGDLEKLQAKLTAIAAERPSVDQVRPGATPAAVAGRAPAIAAVRELGPVSEPIRGSRVVAVFDHDHQKRVMVAKNTAGGTRPPF